MRIWHDNSGVGVAASWYLNYVVVRDVQTGDNFEFIANCWFAVEEGDGCVSVFNNVCFSIYISIKL